MGANFRHSHGTDMEPHAVYATRLGFRWRKSIASHPGIVALLVSSVATIHDPPSGSSLELAMVLSSSG